MIWMSRRNSPPKLGGVPFARFSANGGVVSQEKHPVCAFRGKLCGLIVALMIAGGAFAQTAQPLKNPKDGNPEAVRTGTAVYRARCAACHGNEARGAAAGCELTELWTAGGTDQTIFQNIRRGIPNTIKAHSFGPDDDVWSMMAYLRTLDTGRASAGNARNGERLFNANCIQCHQANGRGGRLGPDLSRVG